MKPEVSNTAGAAPHFVEEMPPLDPARIFRELQRPAFFSGTADVDRCHHLARAKTLQGSSWRLAAVTNGTAACAPRVKMSILA